jgi:CubicO group peptidase (beta-lactamase class C family)
MKAIFKRLILASALTLLSISSVITNAAEADAHGPQTLEELKITIEKIRKDTNTPAVGIALVNKDGPYWIAGLGEADIEKHTKADENTMFRIGSVSKMFVALSVLKLVEEGKLHLNDKLHDLAPEIQYENKWEKSNPILLVNLLEHTTGWDELHLAEISYKATDSTSLKDALDSHPDSRKSRWVPGTRYSYTNTGPGVTAYIIEKVTGKKYEDYVQETFFSPLQMNTTTFYKTNTYNDHEAKLYVSNKPEEYAYQKYRPSGAINASAKDMANFVNFMILRGKFNGEQLLQNTSIDRMETPTSNSGAAQGITAGYGLHNFTTGYEDFGYAFHGHDGGLPGTRTAMMYSSTLGAGYVLMTSNNNGSLWQMSELITRYLLKDSKKQITKAIELSPKFKTLSGVYIPLNPRNEITRFTGNITDAIKISVSDNKIHRSPILGGWESNDYAVGENLLINPWSGLPSISLVKDPTAGEALQIEGDVYTRIPGLFFYGGISFFLLLVILMVGNIISAVIWFPRLLLGQRVNNANAKVCTWPLLASITIITTLLLIALFGSEPIMLGTFTWVSNTIWIGSIVYATLTIVSLLLVYKYRDEPISRFAYGNAVILSILHAILVIYLTYYGIIGFKGWVE